MNIIYYLSLVKNNMKKKLIIVLQARCSSGRLPNKVLRKIEGIPLIMLCIKRLTNRGAKLIVATSNHNSDDKLVKLLKKNKVDFFRGDLNNVLSRYQSIAKSLNREDYIIRATADNSFPDGDLVKKVFKEFVKSKKDYFGIDHLCHNLPRGISLEIFKAKKILELKKDLTKSDKEHVTQFIYRTKSKGFYKKIIKSIKSKIDHSQKSVSIDTYQDLNYVKKIFKNIKDPSNVSMKKLLKLI